MPPQLLKLLRPRAGSVTPPASRARSLSLAVTPWSAGRLDAVALTAPIGDGAVNRRTARPSGSYDEAPVSIGGDVVANLAVGADAADVGHESSWLTRDVRPGVPGLAPWIERLVGHLVDVGVPRLLGRCRRFDRR